MQDLRNKYGCLTPKVNLLHRNLYQRAHQVKGWTYERGRLKDSTFQQGVVNQREPNLAKHTAKSYDECDRKKTGQAQPGFAHR